MCRVHPLRGFGIDKVVENDGSVFVDCVERLKFNMIPTSGAVRTNVVERLCETAILSKQVESEKSS